MIKTGDIRIGKSPAVVGVLPCDKIVDGVPVAEKSPPPSDSGTLKDLDDPSVPLPESAHA